MNLSLPIPELEEKTDEEIATNKPWKVIVLNDPVNLMNYVVMVFRKVFGYDETKATKHMMEVHELGKSVLWVGEREQAESYMYQLQRWKLQTVWRLNALAADFCCRWHLPPPSKTWNVMQVARIPSLPPTTPMSPRLNRLVPARD